jgi:hypothetical protein
MLSTFFVSFFSAMEIEPSMLFAMAAAFMLAVLFLTQNKKQKAPEKVNTTYFLVFFLRARLMFQSTTAVCVKIYPIILGFATGNPPYKVTQQQAADIAERAPAVQEVRPLIQRIYGNGKISSRYMAVPDFTPMQVIKVGLRVWRGCDPRSHLSITYASCWRTCIVGGVVAGSRRRRAFLPTSGRRRGPVQGVGSGPPRQVQGEGRAARGSHLHPGRQGRWPP